jgi:Pyridine nucleotide-disulphide oxidoreductase
MTQTTNLPVAVIGGGPVGLAAAAHLKERGLQPLVLEGGPSVGHSMRQWGHVRLFSPWRYVVDHASKRALLDAGWVAPDDELLPTGLEVVEKYLEPLAALDSFAGSVRVNMRVVAISRRLVDKVKTPNRDAMPFVVRAVDAGGTEHDILASAVIDASGTWRNPNPMGANGLPARGERANADRIRYGIPDVLGAERARYAGKRTLVLGTGHSAINTLLALAELIDADSTTRVFWGMRRSAPGNAFGGGDADALPARGALGTMLRAHVEAGSIRILTALQVGSVEEQAGSVVVRDVAGNDVARVDEIVVATGARPDLEMLRELRLDLDPALESPRVLGPLIDPNEHSCGSVRPHGAFELEQPEKGFFIAGMKSYGRAPTFLLATGYEQVRSVAAYLAGDFAAAREVMLDLPETGVCNVTFGDKDTTAAACCGVEPKKEVEMSEVNAVAEQAGTSACCGGPAPKEAAGACCVKDADAKAAGESGCGCGVPKPAATSAPAASSCCGS